MYVKNLVSKIVSRGPVSVALAVVLSVLVVTATVGAATTISTDINTGGTLTVTGASTLTGDVSAAGALTVTGASTLTGNVSAAGTLTVTGATALNGSTTIGNALTDNITIAGHATTSGTLHTLGNFRVNGYATTTASSGDFATAGTLSAVGLSTFTGGFLSSASSTMQNFTGLNATTTNATTTSTLYVTGNSYVGGRATTTASTGAIATEGGITIGNSGSLVAKLLKGTCTLGTVGASSIDVSHAASTTKAYSCAVTGVISTDLVFAQLSTSTPPSLTTTNWWITGAQASSTDGYIVVNIYNAGNTAIPSTQSVGSSTAYLIIR